MLLSILESEQHQLEKGLRSNSKYDPLKVKNKYSTDTIFYIDCNSFSLIFFYFISVGVPVKIENLWK